jgi:serine/threonine protein kinase
VARDFGPNYVVIGDGRPYASGGFADVFKARNRATDELVAVKVLRASESSEQTAKLYEREVRALLDLLHPNIVQLIDYGRTSEHGDFFLVLEWIDSDLLRHLGDSIPPPLEFVERIALPLARALDHAHSYTEGWVHRDVKPSNVLVTATGQPKLADFGIAKLRAEAYEGFTAPLGDGPYVAPYSLSNPHSPKRDVFGFGRLMLRCLSGVTPRGYEDIPEALEALSALPTELVEFIERCLSEDPLETFASGSDLCIALEGIHDRERRRTLPQSSVPIRLTLNAAKQVTGTDDPNLEQALRLVLDDINDHPFLSYGRGAIIDQSTVDSRTFNLVGREYRYGVVVSHSEKFDRLELVLKHATEIDANAVDNAVRFDYLAEGFKFVQSARGGWDTDGHLARLIQGLDTHNQLRESERQRKAEEQLLDVWDRQISARERIDENNQRAVPFTGCDVKGLIGRFTKDPLDELAAGELRLVMAGSPRVRRMASGTVARSEDDWVELSLTQAVDSIPQTGTLVFDTSGSQKVIRREREALNVLRSAADLARPDLRDLIVDPLRCRAPEPIDIREQEWSRTDIDDDKQDAVRRALGSQDIFLVEGPPGTGKTTFIAELVAQVVRRNPAARVLIASQTNVALDNALERIGKLPELRGRVVRLPAPDPSKLSPGIAPYLLPGIVEAWRDDAIGAGTTYLESECERAGLAYDEVGVARDLRTLYEIVHRVEEYQARLREIRTLIKAPENHDQLDELQADREDLRQHLADARSEADLVRRRLSTRQAAAGLDLDGTADEILDLAELLTAGNTPTAQRLGALVKLQSDWHQVLRTRAEDFYALMLQRASVIGGTCIGIAGLPPIRATTFDLCIVDEASKATATETLVPMVLAKRWVLVGDVKQLPPYVEQAMKDPELLDSFQLSKEELGVSLFSLLADTSFGLPQPSRARLVTQRRMTEAIGRLISHCFYDDSLISEGPDPLDPIAGLLDKPVTWLSTARLSDRAEAEVRGASGQTTYVNDCEASQVRKALRTLDRLEWPERPRVLIIAPYSAQKQRLERVKRQVNAQNIDVEVNTVDAVQGREATVVIFSVTRSNRQRNPGFLSAEARANVALSRAQRALIIVGDHSFCDQTKTPLADVARFVVSHPDLCSLTELTTNG